MTRPGTRPRRGLSTTRLPAGHVEAGAVIVSDDAHRAALSVLRGQRGEAILAAFDSGELDERTFMRACLDEAFRVPGGELPAWCLMVELKKGGEE